MPRDSRPEPSFLVLGAAKSGTTSLCHYLAQHPDVCFSEPKEPLFFEAEYERGPEFYAQKYFSHWQGEPAIGEGRVYNLYLPYVAERIARSLPEARLVALLRDPVERAFSHWWHRHSRGLEPLGFEEAVERNLRELEAGRSFEGEEGARRWREGLYRNTIATRFGLYLDLGFYADQIERYLRLFPRERLQIVFYEDLAADPHAVTREVWRFVGVDPAHPLADPSIRNERRGRMRSPAVARLLKLAHASGVRRVVPRPLRRRAYDALPEKEARRPGLAPETRRALRARFDADVHRLEALAERDLSAWTSAADVPRRAQV